MELLQDRIRVAEDRLRRIQQNAAPTVPRYGLSSGSFTPPPPERTVIAVIAGFSFSTASKIGVITTLTGSQNPADIQFQEVSTPLFNGESFSVAYNGSIFVACGGDGTENAYITSPDGLNWNIGHIGSEDYLPFDIIWCPSFNLFVSGGAPQTGIGNPFMASSPDGITWTRRTSPWDADSGSCGGFAWSPFENVLLACGDSEAGSGIFYVMMKSTNGTSWTSIDSSPHVGNQTYRGLWDNNFGWAVVGPAGDGTGIMTNAGDENTATSWITRRTGGIWTDIAKSLDGGAICAISTSSIVPVVRSNDGFGVTWSAVSSPPTVGGNNLTGITWTPTGHFFIAPASNGDIFTSVDGDSWTKTLHTVGFGPSRLVGV